nr:apolipoprotein N-acyltransferase [Treponema sp.]
MSGILQVFFVFFSGILHTSGIPNELLLKYAPFGIPAFGLAALIPCYTALSHAHSYKASFFLMGIQAFTVHITSSFWLANFKDYALFTLGASALGTAFIACIFGWFFHIPYSDEFRKHTWTQTPAFRICYFAATWTVWEWTKSSGFLAYPWGTISMTAYPLHRLTQIVDITGVYGISFLFAFFAAICGEALSIITSPAKIASFARTCIAFSVLIIASMVYGFVQTSKPRPIQHYLNTILVQQNKDPWLEHSDNRSILISQEETQKALQAAQSQGKPTDLIVWSEAVLSRPFPWAINYYRGNPRQSPLLSFIDHCNVPFIIGAPYTFNREKGQYGNAAILIDKNGTYVDAYNKIHLVPFAESIPGMEFEWVRTIMDSIVGFSNGWYAGRQYKVFTIDTHTQNNQIHNTTISTPICFEDAFPSICRKLHKAGSEVFVNITDDSWSLTTSAEYQHFVIAALRAIEFRTTLLRSTNSGYSAVVDPTGTIIADLDVFTQTAKHIAVPVYKQTTTFYEVA